MTRFVAIDPSGNYGQKEGYGTTGLALFQDGELKDFCKVSAMDFDSQIDYWLGVIKALKVWHDPQDLDFLVCESYKLFGHKAKQQSGSSLDTPQLIGFIRYWLWEEEIELVYQDPKDKVRVADPILVHMGILEATAGNRYRALGRSCVIHERDSIRHGVYHVKYGKR